MDENRMRERLDEMADARRDALTTRARRDATMALLERDGHVTQDGLDTYLAQVHQPPTRKELADQVARKAAAAVEHADQQAAAAIVEADAARAVRDRVAERHNAAEQVVADADQRVTDTAQAAADARELAAFAARWGDPHTAPHPTNTQAHAEPAQAAGGSAGASI